jgi:hypothetical protein
VGFSATDHHVSPPPIPTFRDPATAIGRGLCGFRLKNRSVEEKMITFGSTKSIKKTN